MTHEELLKIIEAFDSNKWGDHNAWAALRAVVELHKPSSEGLKLYSHYNFCTFEVEYEYPCPTIQAIEKELS